MMMIMVGSEVMAMPGGYRASSSEIDHLDALMNIWPFLSTNSVKSEAEVINGGWAFIYNFKSRPEISVRQ
ncbi:hypothetical protein ACN42_g5409 [Penicillium freii]|uniref:Uncharacterized protein n=1 Tax=Penicillium freii TaxID=48697 RepID=A0A101MJJ5_PENFR|nr:hypothetical protein ACN42_g5409 [Penicillium freii]